jgi:hypothetical protein
MPDGPPLPSVFKARIGALREWLKAEAPPFLQLQLWNRARRSANGALRNSLMFTVAITGGLSCRSSLTPRAAITFLVSGIE